MREKIAGIHDVAKVQHTLLPDAMQHDGRRLPPGFKLQLQKSEFQPNMLKASVLKPSLSEPGLSSRTGFSAEDSDLEAFGSAMQQRLARTSKLSEAQKAECQAQLQGIKERVGTKRRAARSDALGGPEAVKTLEDCSVGIPMGPFHGLNTIEVQYWRPARKSNALRKRPMWSINSSDFQQSSRAPCGSSFDASTEGWCSSPMESTDGWRVVETQLQRASSPKERKMRMTWSGTSSSSGFGEKSTKPSRQIDWNVGWLYQARQPSAASADPCARDKSPEIGSLSPLKAQAGPQQRWSRSKASTLPPFDPHLHKGPVMLEGSECDNLVVDAAKADVLGKKLSAWRGLKKAETEPEWKMHSLREHSLRHTLRQAPTQPIGG